MTFNEDYIQYLGYNRGRHPEVCNIDNFVVPWLNYSKPCSPSSLLLARIRSNVLQNLILPHPVAPSQGFEHSIQAWAALRKLLAASILSSNIHEN